MKFDLGLAHGAPEFVMRYKFDGGSLRFSVGALGRVGLVYHRPRLLHRARLVIEMDVPDRDYGLSCLFSF